MILYAVGPRTNEEITALLNNKPASVRGSNSTNMAMGFVSMYKPSNKEAVFTITPHGIAHLKSLPETKPGERVPASRAHPVKDKILFILRNGGLKATDFAKVTTTRNRLYIIINELKKLDYPIKKKKTDKFVTYYLDA